MNAAEPGRLLAGRYRLSAVIGHGGMGVVWRAHDEALDRDVAVKELAWPADFTAHQREQACRRATREAQTAARLNHPNVIRIYDIVEEDGHPWIVMELLPYQSLRDLVAEEGPLIPARAARVGLEILAALRAAHAAGVVHRDVKPANILVGADDRVVLTDFGIARAADSPTLTTAGVLIGSPSYIAPERARGGKSTARGDLWGLGASLYTAVEGRPPFERNGALASLTAVVADEPDPATHAGPLWPVISGLLRKNPAERLDADETERMLSALVSPPPAHRPAAPTAPFPADAEPDGAPANHAPAIPPPPAPPAIDPPAPAPANQPPAAPVLAGLPPADSPPAVSGPTEAGDAQPKPAAPLAADSPPAVPAPGELIPGLAVPAGRAAADAAPPHSAPAPAAADGAPTGPASASRGTRRRLPALAGLAALVVVAAAAVGVALALTGSPGHQAAAPSASTRPSAHASTPASGGATSSPSSSVSASPGAASGALPAGWYRFTNSTGFSIGVPQGWVISHVGHYVYITDPDNGGIFLLIDQSDQPKPNPLADWQQQAAARQGGYPDYHLIRLAAVSYPQAEAAADWEFTYDRNGVLVHILNRNVLANADHAYALYWSTPEVDWTAYFHYFQSFAATFRPAPA